MSREGKWLIVAVLLSIIILFFMARAFIPASFLSFILFSAALIEKIIRISAAKTAFDKAKSSTASTKESSDDQMTVKQAIEMFEIDEMYMEEDVRAAYKRLMNLNHPDKGGSKYIASEINHAREILLKHRGYK